MFESVDELIEENDRRCAMEVDTEPDDEPLQFTLEYYSFKFQSVGDIELTYFLGRAELIEDMKFSSSASPISKIN
jgi:hypothetical protein